MDHLLSQLILYGDMPEDSILMQMGDICRCASHDLQTKDVLITRCYTQLKRILVVSTDYAFDRNLWQNYLTFLLITDENPFTLTCEKMGAGNGSVNSFAKNDYRIFRDLFHYDFSWLEEKLGISCFRTITDYKAIEKPELMYNKNVSEKVRKLSIRLAGSENEESFFDVITGFYQDYGVGMFGLNKAFRFFSEENSRIRFRPINNMDEVVLDDLIGYEIQKQKLVENTKAFVEGRKANNCLLFGDSGTGKSTCIKAIVNAFYPCGLRMIEIYKHQFRDLSNVIAAIKNRNYKFIIYMDDLSFEEFEIEYKFLKAVIEGGVETRPENVLIYATSNRRHLIRETWKDRDDVENDNGMHRSDTIEEKLSLVHRFGVTISFSKPGQQEYFRIVEGLARRAGITMSDEELRRGANAWELSHGGISGRTAEQYVTHLLSMQAK
ncbi:MAG: ATP-binding protein [Eubacterium sp.]|nr:ATP-binding protein [Eubacterium sp.]